MREHFSKLGVAAIAREEGVSLVRFEGLVRLLRDSLQSHDREEVPLGLCGSAVLLAHLWGSAASKQCLLEFLAALQEHVPSLLDERSELHCPEWRRAWLDMAFGTPIESVEPSLPELATAAPAELEVLAHALCSPGDDRPEVAQERHGFRGQKAVADCVECCLRDVLGLCLFDEREARFDASALPPGVDRAVAAFFAGDDARSARAGRLWFDVCSARPGLEYMRGEAGALGQYELWPSPDSFASALGSLIGEAPPPPRADAMQPLWAGCAVGWQLQGGDGPRPLLRVRRLTGCQAAASGASARLVGTTSSSDVLEAEDVAPFRVAGGAAASAVGGSLRLRRSPAAAGGEFAPGSETLRIVFNPGVHCYALRAVMSDEPRWLDGVRRRTLEQWRQLSQQPCLPPPAATSRLLGRALLQARAHAGNTVGGRLAAQSAVLSVLSAVPIGFDERAQALPLVIGAGAEAWWVLPLLLRQPPAGWDDLSLGVCAETLADEARRTPAASAAIAEAIAEPALAVLMGIQLNNRPAIRAAASRCVEWSQRAQLVRIAIGFSGLSLAQRLSALHVFGLEWLIESAHGKQLQSPQREMAAGAATK